MVGLNLASFMFKSYTNPEKKDRYYLRSEFRRVTHKELLKKIYSAATDMSKGAIFLV
jgi:hypothetical protein